MRIVQAVSGVGIDGATRHALDLSLLLVERGHNVTLVCRAESWAARQAESAGIARYETVFRRKRANFHSFLQFLGDNAIDVVHTHKSSANAFGAILRTLYRIPVVATAHGRHLQLHWRFNDHVIAPSDHTALFLRRVNRVPRQRISVITLPYRFTNPTATPSEISAFRRSIGLRDDAFTIGVVGTVEPRKGLLTLARALPRIRQCGVEIAIVAVGSIDQRYGGRVRRQTEIDGTEPSLILTGPIDNVASLMPAFDLVCLPSREEQMPVAILEAMAASRPVVVSPVGGLVQLIRDGVDGAFAPPGHPDQWADAIVRMATDESLRRRLGMAGRARVESYCCPDRVVAEITSIYSRVSTLRTGKDPD